MSDNQKDIPSDCPARDRCEEDRLQREALHAHHRLLAQQIAQTLLDYRALHDRMDSTDARLAHVESSLAANSEATRRIDENTAGLVSTFNTLSNGIRVIGWIGNAGKAGIKVFLWLGIPGAIVLLGWERARAAIAAIWNG